VRIGNDMVKLESQIGSEKLPTRFGERYGEAVFRIQNDRDGEVERIILRVFG
jgi:hypothetical protein